MTLKLVHVIKFENEKKIIEIKLEFEILYMFADKEFSAGSFFFFHALYFRGLFSGMVF